MTSAGRDFGIGLSPGSMEAVRAAQRSGDLNVPQHNALQ
jgi:hypothetical protein